jgi:Flp pilus assembly pilin Flp
MYLWLANAVGTLRRDEGQGVSEYAMILVLIVLIVVSVVHAIGSNAQQVIDKVNAALHIG